MITYYKYESYKNGGKMSKNRLNHIRSKIRYFDYIGLERYGTIVAMDPYPLDPSIRYVYIEDEDPNENIYQIQINNNTIFYADIRLSSEVVIIGD